MRTHLTSAENLDSKPRFEETNCNLDIARIAMEEVGRITKIKLNRMALGDNGKAVLLEAVDSLKKSVNKTKSSEVTSIDDLSRMLDLMRKK